MWAAILLGLLVGATASEEQYLWKPRTEYLYNISSVSLTAINQLANQWTGIAYNISLAAKLRTPDILQIQIKKVLKGGIHANLSGGFENPIPDELINWAPGKLSKYPFELVYENGKIIDVRVHCSLNNTEINLLKGIASLFQIDMDKEKGSVFSEYEETVTGNCQTQYTRTPLPKYLLQDQNILLQPRFLDSGSIVDVAKEVNFTRCQKSRTYSFGADQRLNGSAIADSLAQSSNSRAVLVNTSDSYLLGSSKVTHKIAVSPFLYKQQKAMIASRMVALLTNFYPIRGPSDPAPKCPTGGLVYKFNIGGQSSRVSGEYEPNEDKDDVSSSSEGEEENARRRRAAGPSESQEPEYLPQPSLKYPPSHPFDFLFVGNEGSSIQSDLKINATWLVLKYSKGIGEALYRPNEIPQKQTLSHYVLLINLIQTFNASSLQNIADELYDDQSPRKPASQYAWVAFVNAVSQAGTGPALRTVIYMVNENMLRGQAAADAVAYIPRAARVPNNDYLDAFYNFASKNVQGKYPVNNTAILAFSELVYLSQVSNSSVNRYPVSAYEDLLESVNQTYINYLDEQLEKAIVKGYSPNIQLYIRALGNIGHPKILDSFKIFLEGVRKITSFQRFMMVMALDKVIEAYPQRAQEVLLQLFQNVAETHEIRCAAALLVMAANPSPAIVQNLAQLTNSDQNSQVRAAVKTIIESAVNLQHPKDDELARAAHSAVKLLTSEEFGYDKSLGNVKSSVLEKLGLSYRQWLRLIGSVDSSVHSTFSFQLQRYHGQLLRHEDELTSMVSSVQLLMRVVLNQTADHNYERPSPKSLLGVSRNVSEPLEGNILLDALGAKSFVAFDNTTIAVLKAALMSEIERIKDGKSYNKTILVNSAAVGVGFPTILGMPASVRFNAPVAIALRVKADLDAPSNGRLLSIKWWKTVKAVNVSSNISVVYSSQMSSKISIIDALAKEVYESSLVQNVQAYLPIKLNVSYDFKNNVTTIQAEPANTDKKYQLYHVSRVPTTARWALVPLLCYREDRRLVHVRPNVSWQHVYGPKSTGMAFELRYQSEAEFLDRKAAADQAEAHDYLSAGYFPLASETVFYYNHSLYYSPEHSVAKNVTIRVRAFIRPYSEYVPPQGRPRGYEDEGEEESYRAKRSPKFGRKRSAESSEAEFYKQAVIEQSKLSVPFAELAKKPIEEAVSDRVGRIYERGTTYILEVDVIFEQPRGGKYRFSVAHSRNSVKSTAILTAHVYSLPASKEPFQAYVNALGYFPALPAMNFEKALSANPNSNLSIVYVSRNGTAKEAKIIAQVQAQRSASFKQHLISSAVAKQCREQMAEENTIQYACRNATEQAGYLDEFELKGWYSNLSPESINATYKAFSYLKHKLYPFLSERVNLSYPQPLGSGRFNASLKFSPTWHAFNASVTVPSIYLNLTNVRGWNPASITPLHPSRHVAERLSTVFHHDRILPACALDKDNVTTFDNLTIPLILPNCWTTVLAYAPKPTWHNEFVYENVSVSIRPSAQGGREIQIQVGKNIIEQYTPSFIIVNKDKHDLHTQTTTVVEVNGKVLVEGARLPGVSSWIVVPSYGLQVYFDGLRALVRANYTYKDAVRGLCGTYDGEVITDLTIPTNCIVRDPKVFAASYSLLNSECKDPLVLRRTSGFSCYPYEIIPGYYIKAKHIQPVARDDLRGGEESFGSDESDSSDSYQQSEKKRFRSLKSKVRPVPAIRALEHKGRYAFSIVRVPTCLPPLTPREVQVKPIPFHSVKKSPASKHWFEAVSNSPLSYDFSNKKHDVTIDIKIHISCKAH